ncbi:clavesin-2-like [Mercenaria mercenaria]|uniref:clavesin-2-like n=1 Tax=Mercenaria mercenaria TaxID=6596 RepID=UPI00234E4F0F|nr:clavesin-2-like [Mercenaria mercenaria]
MNAKPDDNKFISNLDEEGKKKAKEELNELNDEDRQIALQTFRQWVVDLDWLKSPTDFAFLLRFLRVRKFSQLGARETLENYLKGRTNSPEWFQNVDPSDEIIQEIFKSGFFQCPMKYDRKGRRILLCNFCDMLDDMKKPAFLEHIKDLSSDKYRVDIEKRKTDDTPAASFRKLNVS